MKSAILIVVLGIAAAFAAPFDFDLVEDDVGDRFYLVPVVRERRAAPPPNPNGGSPTTDWKIVGPDPTVLVQHKGTILKGDDYHLTGSAYAAKDLTNLKHLEPEKFGGDVKLTHDSGFSGTLSADRFRSGPTDVKAALDYNLYQDKNLKFDLGAAYQTQFGGPGPNRHDSGVFLTGGGRW